MKKNEFFSCSVHTLIFSCAKPVKNYRKFVLTFNQMVEIGEQVKTDKQ